MNLKGNKKIRLFFIAGITVLCIGIISGKHILDSFTRVTTDDAYIEGRIHSIASKIPGTVLKVYAQDNQGVKKDDLLLEIDPADYELIAHQAQAALDAQKARLLDAQAQIKTAMANLEIQEVTVNQAALDKERGEALYKEQVITKERDEKVITAYNLAVAQAKAAKERLDETKSVKGLEESVIKEREAALKIAQLNVGYTKIYSPSDGYITHKSVEVGNQIQPIQPLMAVVALDDIWVVANYKETQLKNVKPGQFVIIKIDTYPGKFFTGRVNSIMAGTGAVFSLFPPENALGNYVKVVQRIPVKIVFDKTMDNQRILRIGMSCVPTIITKNEPH